MTTANIYRIAILVNAVMLCLHVIINSELRADYNVGITLMIIGFSTVAAELIKD